MDRRACCTACGGDMELDIKRFALGGDGWGGLSSLMTEQYEVDLYRCTQCGKIALYAAAATTQEAEEMVRCPNCGAEHSPVIGCPRCALNRASGGMSRTYPPKKKKEKLPWEK